MAADSTSGGVDVENPIGAAPTSSGGSSSAGIGRKKKWALMSAFLLVAGVVAVSLGVTLGGGKSAVEKYTSSSTDNAAAPTTTTTAANDGGDTFDATHVVDEEEVEAFNMVRYLDNPEGGGKKSKVRIVDPTVTRGYKSCDDLKEDLRNAVNFFIDSVIAQEANYSEDIYYDPCADSDETNSFLVEDVAKSAKAADAGDDIKKENSYGTKNQVYGVDEADFVKSDGEFVFAAYGEYLYAWNAIDGASKGVSITELPYAKVNICNFTTVAPTPFEDTETSSNSTMSQEPCFFSQPKPVIVALLLHDQRLTAIVSEDNYLYSSSGEAFSYSSSGEILLTKRTPKIITDYTKLTIRIYDISSVPTDDSPLTLIAKSEKPIMAGYSAAVSKKNSGVLAVTAYIDSSSLVYDLYRLSTKYCGLNSTEYKKLAMETASNNRTETFVESMLEELQLQLNGTCESIVQVSAMQSGDSTQDATNGNLLVAFMQVIRFDMASDFIDGKVVISDVGGTLSSAWPYVYATQDFLATITDGSYYNSTTSVWDAASFIIGFDISGDTTAAPKPFCFAEVSGSTSFGQYSVDLFDGHLRVLTSEYFWSETTSNTTSIISVLKVPPPMSDAGTEMLLTGEISLELTNDSVVGARFMEDWAFVEPGVGPSHVYDLSNPSAPRDVGGLDTSSGSYYFDPINIDGVPHLLGLGMVYNETTWVSSLKITLFDVSDHTKLQVKATYVDQGAYSNSGYDIKSSRYLEHSQKLIVPKTESDYTGPNNNFDGFAVYGIYVTDIEPIYEIRHILSDDVYNFCINTAYLPARSFVFESKLTTMLSHSVIGTDLETGDHLWTYNLEDGSNTIDCKSYGDV
ncbi:hypothetical protein ACHAWU_007419 [Discostella pseudostelligera]|uniref:Uncharacterized protein n=1 Tax=Discostella pseudostelligera TaxID=259834 RepID=A0ABD3MLS4_9STRA